MDKIQEITKHVLALYDLWKSYDEKKEIASILQKMPKPKSTPSQNWRWSEFDRKEHMATFKQHFSLITMCILIIILNTDNTGVNTDINT